MGNDLLEKKIDTNTNKNLEQQEVINFTKSEKNLQELGNYLSKTVGGWSDNLVRVSSDVITKSIVNIDKKVRGNQLLSVEEKALINNFNAHAGQKTLFFLAFVKNVSNLGIIFHKYLLI